LPYVPAEVLDGFSLGVGPLKEPGDLFVDDAGHIYLLDTGNNRLICLDSSMNVTRVISQFDNDGKPDGFNGPRGVFVTSQGDIYVADTGNGRVVILDSQGQFVRLIGEPVSDEEGIIPEDYRYKPIRLVVDVAKRVFVVVEGEYEGIVQFDEQGTFRGFFGAPRVVPRLADVIWSKLATREQRERMALFLPTEYSSVDLDDRGFIYATIATGDLARSQPIWPSIPEARMSSERWASWSRGETNRQRGKRTSRESRPPNSSTSWPENMVSIVGWTSIEAGCSPTTQRVTCCTSLAPGVIRRAPWSNRQPLKS